MKKYRTEARDISTEANKDFERTQMIVWLGSSEYWDYVYLCKADHRLYVRVQEGRIRRFEALDTFNLRKIETF